MQKNAKVGIWGFGIVGKSALAYFKKRGYSVTILDQRSLNLQEKELLATSNTPFLSQEHLTSFLQDHDYILPSCGIDLRPYKAYEDKWLSELDLFAAECTTPLIAITGSVGKTTTTHLLSEILRAQGKTIFTGGNIGIGLLERIEEANAADYVILEVSSFQLELCKKFSPALALWTNFYPNHLDRHDTVHDYFKAKIPLITHQPPTAQAILPLPLKEMIPASLAPTISWFYAAPLTHSLRASLKPEDRCFFIEDSHCKVYQHGKEHTYATLSEEALICHIENLLLITAALFQLGLPLNTIATILAQSTLPEHRLEKVATINQIEFYNDSKSTIPVSTLAALQKLQGKNIILFLGGTSKGMNRCDFVSQLTGKVKNVYCFGKEAEQLHQWCTQFQIPSTSYATLDDAFEECVKNLHTGETVLLSPSGASHDLFANYQERGNHFKKLVLQLKK